MERLPVVHKTKLNKEQTYFVNAAALGELLADCRCRDDLALDFTDAPTAFKSEYDRFVRQKRKLVVLSAHYAPKDTEPAGGVAAKSYTVTVYAIVRTIREDLVAQFEEKHFAALLGWLSERRDATWLAKPHSIVFLLDIDTEEVSVAHDIDFSDYGRRAKETGSPIRRAKTMRR